MNATAIPPTACQLLGHFVADTDYANLPPALVAQAKRSLLNFIGAAVAVAQHPAVEIAIEIALERTGESCCTVFGRKESLGLYEAAAINAVMGNLLDFDDTHLRTVIHPSAPVVPTALALAQNRGFDGKAVLTAIAVGAEVECRIGNAVSPGHYARGWHITSSCGVFGAAATAAKLLRLDAVQTSHALAIAASQSAGLVENLTEGAKNIAIGNCVRNGIEAAFFAQRGYAGAATALEGKLGWAAATGSDWQPACIDEGLSDNWEFTRNTFKPYPCGIVLHSVIDACLALAQAHSITANNIESVAVFGDALLLARGDRAVHDERDARVSIHHAVAIAFTYQQADITEFTASAVFDPAITQLRSRVEPRLDQTMPTGSARVELVMADGSRFSKRVDYARGSEQLPLSDQDIEAKARSLAAFGGSNCDIDAVICAAATLEQAASVIPLLTAAAAQ